MKKETILKLKKTLSFDIRECLGHVRWIKGIPTNENIIYEEGPDFFGFGRDFELGHMITFFCDKVWDDCNDYVKRQHTACQEVSTQNFAFALEKIISNAFDINRNKFNETSEKLKQLKKELARLRKKQEDKVSISSWQRKVEVEETEVEETEVEETEVEETEVEETEVEQANSNSI